MFPNGNLVVVLDSRSVAPDGKCVNDGIDLGVCSMAYVTVDMSSQPS